MVLIKEKFEIKELIDWKEPNGNGCIVSNKITVEGYKVGYMFRKEPLPNKPDSGWYFLKGDEDDAYMDEPSNHRVFAINTLCNYDPEVIPYLHAPIGSAFIRVKGGKFIEDDGTQAIVFEKQKQD